MIEYTLIKSSTDEVLRVTPDGEFIWHPDADRLIEECDVNNSLAMRHILRALRAKRKWVGLTPEERDEIHEKTYGAQIGRAHGLNSSHIPLSRMPSSA